MNPPSQLPLVVHLLYRLDFGGLETLLVQCVNRMPAYRHAVVCLTGYNAEFAKKISRPDVEILALNKQPGLGLSTHTALWKLLRRLHPAVLHTYNLAAAEYAFTATFAGVPVRVHAEHGRSADDPDGLNRKHNLLRRLLVPFIDCFVPVSADLQRWLGKVVGVPEAKNRLIMNGVDTDIFHPEGSRVEIPGFPAGAFVIGTVGRIQDVKDHASLIDAFQLMLKKAKPDARPLRLAIVGNGPLLDTLKEKVRMAGIEQLVWFPGARTDIADIMRSLSVFALSSIAEGTPVTILEAMSSGLPVAATRVGGIPEAVADDITGILVPPSDPSALAGALLAYYEQPELTARHGGAGRERVVRHYSLSAMLDEYSRLYDRLYEEKLRKPLRKPCAE